MRPLPVRSRAFSIGLEFGCSASSAQRQTSDAREYRVKAALLYNFAKFVEWPTGGTGSRQGAIVVGVVGHDPFGPILEQTLEGKTVRGRSLRAKRVMTYNSHHNRHQSCCRRSLCPIQPTWRGPQEVTEIVSAPDDIVLIGELEAQVVKPPGGLDGIVVVDLLVGPRIHPIAAADRVLAASVNEMA